MSSLGITWRSAVVVVTLERMSSNVMPTGAGFSSTTATLRLSTYCTPSAPEYITLTEPSRSASASSSEGAVTVRFSSPMRAVHPSGCSISNASISLYFTAKVFVSPYLNSATSGASTNSKDALFSFSSPWPGVGSGVGFVQEASTESAITDAKMLLKIFFISFI